MNRILTYTLLFVAASFSLSLSLNFSMDIEKYILNAWTRDTGLSHHTIFAIEQTADGYLWLGTPSGLVRFDGLHFTFYNHQNTPTLPEQKIIALHQDNTGCLWIGTAGGGLICFHEGNWTSYTNRDGLSDNYVRTITSDFNGILWVGTDYGLNRIDPEGIQHYTTKDGLLDNVILSLTTDWQGYLWIGTLRGGLSQFQSGVVRSYGYQEGLTNVTVNALYTDPLNNIWIGTQNGLYYLNNSTAQIRLIAGSKSTPVTSITGDDQGSIWIGTMTDGLKTLKKEQWVGFSTEESFPCGFVRTIFNDQAGNLWIGSDGEGLFQLTNRWMDNITPQQGFPDASINVIYRSITGDFWLGTEGQGLYRLKNGKVTDIYNSEQGLTGIRITALWEDSRRELWIGTADSGLFSLTRNKAVRVYPGDRLSEVTVSAISEYDSLHIWFGTHQGWFGLNRLNRKVSLIAGTDSLYIYTLLSEHNGRLYLGTRTGVYLYQDQQLERLETTKNHQVVSLFADSDGDLWMGTNGTGLLRKNGSALEFFTTTEGLPDNHIFSICEDQNGFLWFSSYQGIFSIPRSEFDRFPDPDFPYIMFTWFNEANGMNNSRCRFEGDPSVWQTSDGLLYYPTAGGIAILDTKKIPADSFIFSIILESLEVDGKKSPQNAQYAFTAPIRNLDIQFAIPEFNNPEKVRFYYQLVGRDTHWNLSAWPDSRQVNYENLGAGRYQFLIKSTQNSLKPAKEQVLLSFNIHPPFYRTFTFMILLVILSVSVFTIVLLRHKQRERQRTKDKYKTSTLDPERAEKAITQLTELMEIRKIYLDPNLTLTTLSKQLRIHPNHLSRIINEKYDLNFNDYINKYRIEEIKQILSDSSIQKLNILEIMYDNGFYSKSVFNTAFKKFTGMTPSEFRRQRVPAKKK
jgi:ligand-binding sensor domain-containing protein/AraC-like DNA-binding protein